MISILFYDLLLMIYFIGTSFLYLEERRSYTPGTTFRYHMCSIGT